MKKTAQDQPSARRMRLVKVPERLPAWVKAMPSCAFRAYISTRAIMRSSVSDGCRASVRLCSA